MPNINRLHTLDYLRGLCAFGIMIYHYFTFNSGLYTSEAFMARLGLYGVSVFYVLSGLTLYLVYYDKMKPSGSDVLDFARRRFYRIFPLLWLVTITAVALTRRIPDLSDLFLNLSGLFGFVKWYAYFSTGVWSIGNELVFYSLFPVFVYLSRKSSKLLAIFSVLIFGIYLYFAFALLNPDAPLADQWRTYINPLNQVFLFLAGFLLGRFGSLIPTSRYISPALFLLAIVIFIFYPVRGNTIALITGVERIIFTIATIALCVSFFRLKVDVPNFVHRPLAHLGEASYSVYLLHPIVYTIADKVFRRIDPAASVHWYLKIAVCAIATLVLSHFVYEYFEKYFMKKGRRVVPETATRT